MSQDVAVTQKILLYFSACQKMTALPSKKTGADQTPSRITSPLTIYLTPVLWKHQHTQEGWRDPALRSQRSRTRVHSDRTALTVEWVRVLVCLLSSVSKILHFTGIIKAVFPCSLDQTETWRTRRLSSEGSSAQWGRRTRLWCWRTGSWSLTWTLLSSRLPAPGLR